MTALRRRMLEGNNRDARVFRSGGRSTYLPRSGLVQRRLRHMLIGYARVSKADDFPVAGPAARRAAGRGRPTPNRDLIGQAETFDRSDRTVRGRSVPHGQPVNWPAYRPSRTRSQSSNA